MNKKKSKYLLKNVVLFTIGTFIPKVIIFIMVPLYTNYLSTSEYGIADLLTNTVTLLMPILTVQVQDAVMKYSITREENKEDILNIGVEISLLGATILLIALFIINSLGIVQINFIYGAYLFVCYLLGSLGNIFAYYCRGIDKVKAIAISSIINTAVTVSLNIVLLVGFKLGLVGYLIAYVIGAAARVLYMVIFGEIWKDLKFKISDNSLIKEMLLFSLPMVFSALSWWINNASDKYILTYFESVSVVGLYAVASKIPSILTSFGEVISKSFSISAIKEFDSDDSDGFLSDCYANISSYMVLTCSVIMLCNIGIAKILFSKEFNSAWQFCPPLLIAVMFNQISLSCENILLAMNKTKVISVTAIIAAISNTILNFILIPHFGAYGAAIATIIGFFISWIIRYKQVRNYINMKNNINKEILSYFLIITQMILAFWGNKYLIIQLFLAVGLYFLFWDRIMNIGGNVVKIIRKVRR